MSEVLELLRKNLFMEKSVDDIAEEEADENMDLLEDSDMDENEDVDLLERPDEKMKEEPKYFPSDDEKLKVDPEAVLSEAMAMNAETIKLKEELQERIFKMESRYSPAEDPSLELNKWVENHPSVPAGWKFKLCGNMGLHNVNYRIMSPNGKIFQGRRQALKCMIEERYPEAEIFEMRNCLEFEGWLCDPSLPEDWLYKSSETGHSLSFIDSLGNLFRGKEEALNTLELRNDLEDLEMFKRFCQKTLPVYSKGKELDQTWMQDHPSVPFGWMVKEAMVGSKTILRILSPERNWFPTHRVALKHMIDQGYPEDVIEEMRNCMKHVGWMSDQLLPENWLYKPQKDYSFEFIDAQGNFMRNKVEAMKCLQQIEDKENVFAMEHFFKNRHTTYNRGKEIDDSWIADDPSVPSGWMVKKVQGLTNQTHHILSPDRIFFSARRIALKHMIENNYPKPEIEEMRDCLQHDGWLFDKALPAKWFYKARNQKDTSNNKHVHISLSFIDSEGNHFRSKEAALKHLIQEGDLKNVAVVANFSQDQSDGLKRNRNIDDSWDSDNKSVPQGWMIKEINFGGNKGFHLLSPEGKIFQGRRMALKYMIEKNFPKEDIEAMRKCLKHDGWMQDSALPTNWFFKEGKYSAMPFIDASGNYLKSREDAFKSLKQMGDFKSIDALKSFFQNRNTIYNKGKEIDDSWTKGDSTLPEGWMIKEVQGSSNQSHHLLSPDRVFFQARRLAVKFMIEKKFPQDEIEKMRNGLKHEGWLTDKTLPNNWFYRSRKNANESMHVVFLDSQGNYHRCKERALKHLKQIGNVAEMTLVANFYEDHSDNMKMDRKIDDKWKSGDPSVPTGWMIKEFKFGKVNQFRLLSPEGKIFQGRRPALNFMISKNFPNDEIEAMRKSLENEGWVRDPALPVNWFYKIGKYCEMKFIDSSGNGHKNKEEAVKSLMQNGDTSGAEALKLFLQNRNTVYNKGKEIDSNWIKGDASVPRGWLVKKFEGTNNKSHILSPDRVFFSARRVALKFMIEKKYPDTEVEVMRKCLKYDGWLSDPRLPGKWLYRPLLHKDSRLKIITFIDSEGNYFGSRTGAMRHLKQSGDLEGFNTVAAFTEEQSDKKNSGRKVDESWTSDPSFPTGWMTKEFYFGKVSQCRVMSPEGKIFQGRRPALKFMIDKKYPEGEVENMRRSLQHDGWLQDLALPEHWFYKVNKNSLSFIDAEANYHRDRGTVLTFLQKQGNVEIMEAVYQFSPNEVKTSLAEAECKTVPPGWRLKERSFAKNNGYRADLLSPEGKIFAGRRAALKYLVDKKYPIEQIMEMRSYLKHEGWKSSDLLPTDWFVKAFKAYELHYLSPLGELFRSKDAVLQYFKSNNFEDFHITNLAQISVKSVNDPESPPPSKPQKIRPKQVRKTPPTAKPKQESSYDGWEAFEEQELADWKYIPGQQKYLSPSGDFLNGRVHLLKFMIDNNFSKEQILSMKQSTKKILIENLSYKTDVLLLKQKV